MAKFNSGLFHGTTGSPQTSIAFVAPCATSGNLSDYPLSNNLSEEPSSYLSSIDTHVNGRLSNNNEGLSCSEVIRDLVARMFEAFDEGNIYLINAFCSWIELALLSEDARARNLARQIIERLHDYAKPERIYEQLLPASKELFVGCL